MPPRRSKHEEASPCQSRRSIPNRGIAPAGDATRNEGEIRGLAQSSYPVSGTSVSNETPEGGKIAGAAPVLGAGPLGMTKTGFQPWRAIEEQRGLAVDPVDGLLKSTSTSTRHGRRPEVRSISTAGEKPRASFPSSTLRAKARTILGIAAAGAVLGRGSPCRGPRPLSPDGRHDQHCGPGARRLRGGPGALAGAGVHVRAKGPDHRDLRGRQRGRGRRPRRRSRVLRRQWQGAGGKDHGVEGEGSPDRRRPAWPSAGVQARCLRRPHPARLGAR
jgi:hypothetical protein